MNANFSVKNALHAFYNDATTFKARDMNAETCLNHISDQIPTDDDQLRIYDALMKLVGGAEPRHVCAVCCRAGPQCDFKAMKVCCRITTKTLYPHYHQISI